MRRSELLEKILNFIKKEAVLVIASVVALITVFIIPPDKKYFEYFNLHVLVMLFCLMAVVQGLVKSGLFDILSIKALKLCKSTKLLAIILVNIVFFSSMFVTNDVALIIFVPFTIGILSGVRQRDIIFVIVMETIAANLGSAAMPFGSPHNLFIYSFYKMDFMEFFKVAFPVSIAGYVVIMLIMCFSKIVNGQREISSIKTEHDSKRMMLNLALFIVCVLCVIRIIPMFVCLGVVLVFVLISDYKVLKKVDYSLLATFVAFFIFVGNIGRIEVITKALENLMEKSVFVVTLIASQLVSNVPSSVMLSEFTDNSKAILLGANIGGLGTIIASLASLISFKLYCKSEDAEKPRFFGIFTLYNVIVMALMIVFTAIVY